VRVANKKWVIKGEIAPEVLFGVLCEPEGGVETTTSCPTRMSERELAKLRSQNGIASKRNRRSKKSRR
jgi:hypothetical protein